MADRFAGKRACFFAGVGSTSALAERQWYQSDIRTLRELGFDLALAVSPKDIPLNSDLYYSWWPTRSIFPLLVAKLRRRPIIIAVGGEEVLHSIQTAESYLSKPVHVRWAIRTCLRYAERVLALSEHIRGEAATLCRREVLLVPAGIDTIRYASDGRARNAGHVLTISKLGMNHFRRKRLGAVLQSIPLVLEEYPDQQFVIAGEKADAFPHIERMVAHLGIQDNIRFTGRVSIPQKIELLRDALLYLQPTMHEGFGYAIAEAMSCCLPVITSPVGSVPEVVGDCGLFVDPDSPEQIATATVHLLAHPEIRAELGRAGRRRIEQVFPYERRKARLAEILEAVL